MTARLWFVLHPLGSTVVEADSAREALRAAFLPLGKKSALAVISASITARPAATDRRAFRAYIGAAPKRV